MHVNKTDRDSARYVHVHPGHLDRKDPDSAGRIDGHSRPLVADSAGHVQDAWYCVSGHDAVGELVRSVVATICALDTSPSSTTAAENHSTQHNARTRLRPIERPFIGAVH